MLATAASPWSWSLGACPIKCQHRPALPSFFAARSPLLHPTRSNLNMRQVPSLSERGMGVCTLSIVMGRYFPLERSKDHLYQEALAPSTLPSSSPLASLAQTQMRT